MISAHFCDLPGFGCFIMGIETVVDMRKNPGFFDLPGEE